MRVDENGKELEHEALIEKYKEYNEGRRDILTLDPNGESFGAVILAAGWRPYEPKADEFANLGWGNADVITNYQFEELAAKGKVTRLSDGKEAKNVVFIQSPGNGTDGDFPFTGAVTSMVALKQAKYVREDYPDANAYIIYQHMRTTGLSEYLYKELQQDPGVYMTKGEVAAVESRGEPLRGRRQHFDRRGNPHQRRPRGPGYRHGAGNV